MIGFVTSIKIWISEFGVRKGQVLFLESAAFKLSKDQHYLYFLMKLMNNKHKIKFLSNLIFILYTFCNNIIIIDKNRDTFVTFS